MEEIERFVPYLFEQSKSGLQQEHLSILKILAKHEPLPMSELEKFAKKEKGTLDRWGLKSRLDGSPHLFGLIPFDYVVAEQKGTTNLGKPKMWYSLTFKGFLASIIKVPIKKNKHFIWAAEDFCESNEIYDEAVRKVVKYYLELLCYSFIFRSHLEGYSFTRTSSASHQVFAESFNTIILETEWWKYLEVAEDRRYRKYWENLFHELDVYGAAIELLGGGSNQADGSRQLRANLDIQLTKKELKDKELGFGGDAFVDFVETMNHPIRIRQPWYFREDLIVYNLTVKQDVSDEKLRKAYLQSKKDFPNLDKAIEKEYKDVKSQKPRLEMAMIDSLNAKEDEWERQHQSINYHDDATEKKWERQLSEVAEILDGLDLAVNTESVLKKIHEMREMRIAASKFVEDDSKWTEEEKEERANDTYRFVMAVYMTKLQIIERLYDMSRESKNQ